MALGRHRVAGGGIRDDMVVVRRHGAAHADGAHDAIAGDERHAAATEDASRQRVAAIP